MNDKTQDTPPKEATPQRVVVEVAAQPPPSWKGSSQAWEDMIKAREDRRAAEAQAKEERAAAEAAQKRAAELEAALETERQKLADAQADANARAAKATQSLAFLKNGIANPTVQTFLVQQHQLATAGQEDAPDLSTWLADENTRKSPVYSHLFPKPEPVKRAAPDPHGRETITIPTEGAWTAGHYKEAASSQAAWNAHGADAVRRLERDLGLVLVSDKAKHNLIQQ